MSCCNNNDNNNNNNKSAQDHGSPAAIHFFSPYPNRATESKCKLMLVKSFKSGHKNEADCASIFWVIA